MKGEGRKPEKEVEDRKSGSATFLASSFVSFACYCSRLMCGSGEYSPSVDCLRGHDLCEPTSHWNNNRQATVAPVTGSWPPPFCFWVPMTSPTSSMDETMPPMNYRHVAAPLGKIVPIAQDATPGGPDATSGCDLRM